MKKRTLGIILVVGGALAACMIAVMSSSKDASISHADDKRSHQAIQRSGKHVAAIKTPSSSAQDVATARDRAKQRLSSGNYSEPDLLARDIGLTDDPYFFIEGLRVLLKQTSNLKHTDRALYWQRILQGVKEKGGAPHLMSLLAEVGSEFFDTARQVSLMGCRSLADYLLTGSIVYQGKELSDLEKLINGITDRDQAYAWKSALAIRRLHADPENAISGLKDISDKDLRREVEPAVLANMGYSRYKDAVDYYLSDDCQTSGSRDLAYGIGGKYLKDAPEEFSAKVRDAVPSERRDWLILFMVNRLYQTDRAASETWMREIQSDKVKAVMQRDIARVSQ